jgi:tetratricopeptide (TPR) repeat protein
VNARTDSSGARPRSRRQGRVTPLLTVLLWVLLFSLSCRLEALEWIQRHRAGRSLLLAGLLGESRSALAEAAYERADLYFHRGVDHVRTQAFTRAWAQALGAQVSPSRHTHLEGDGVAEIMPWIHHTLRIDPQRVDAALVAAFWLSNELHRYEAALSVLNTAQQHNPFNDRIALEKARIYLHTGQLDAARRCLDACLAFWPGQRHPQTRDAQLDKAQALLYRALLHEIDGEPGAAARELRGIVRMFPRRESLARRADDLENGRSPDVEARELVARLLDSERGHTTCSMAAHGHGDDGHEHDHDDEHTGHGPDAHMSGHHVP